MIITLEEQEWFPVLVPTDMPARGRTTDVPEELLARHAAAAAEFAECQKLLWEYYDGAA